MGYIAHDAVIATSYYGEGPDVAAWRATLPPEWRGLIVGPVETVVNHNRSWVFLPDGSKEGWGDSDLGDRYRREFIELFQRKEADRWAVDVVSVRFGGDYSHDVGVTAKDETPDYAPAGELDEAIIKGATIRTPDGTQLTSEGITSIVQDGDRVRYTSEYQRRCTVMATGFPPRPCTLTFGHAGPCEFVPEEQVERRYIPAIKLDGKAVDSDAREAIADLRKEVAELRKKVEGQS